MGHPPIYSAPTATPARSSSSRSRQLRAPVVPGRRGIRRRHQRGHPPGEDAVTTIATGGAGKDRWCQPPLAAQPAAAPAAGRRHHPRTGRRRIIGMKPDDGRHAIAILRGLSGRTHQVLTAVVVTDGRRYAHRLSTSQVRFRPLRDAEIRRRSHRQKPPPTKRRLWHPGARGGRRGDPRRFTPASWACPVRGFAACCGNSAISDRQRRICKPPGLENRHQSE